MTVINIYIYSFFIINNVNFSQNIEKVCKNNKHSNNMSEIDLIYKFYGEGNKKGFAINLLAIVETDYDEAKVASDHIPHIAMNIENRSISSASYNTMSLLCHNRTILSSNDGVYKDFPEQLVHSARYDVVATIISRILDKNKGGLALQEFMPFILTRQILIGEANQDLFESQTIVSGDIKVVITPLHVGTSFNNGVFAYMTKNPNVKELSAVPIIDIWDYNGKEGSKTIGQLITVTLQNNRKYKVINLHLDRSDGKYSITLIARLVKDDLLICEIVGDFNLNTGQFFSEWGKQRTGIHLESNYDIPREFQGVDHSFNVCR